MKERLLKIAALVIAACMLAGCSAVDFGGYFDGLGSILGLSEEVRVGTASYTHYADMEYERPGLEEMEQALLDAEAAVGAGEVRRVIGAVYDFYDAYDWFYTCYSLADIRYSGDLTDAYWMEEYGYCTENSAAVDAMLEELYYILANSPCREELESEKYFGAGFFDGYEGENRWDEEVSSLMEQEAALESRYYELSEQSLAYESGTQALYDACAGEMMELLAELIRVRQEIAAFWGYDSYVQFAWDFYYYRDFAPEALEPYLADIRQELVPLYRETADSDVWDAAYRYCPEEDTLDYVRSMAENMGGTVEAAFRLMMDAGLYDIAYGENKYNSSFEVFLTSYGEPFVFMNPGLWRYDCLTLAHEFGHFCNDYASYGTYAGIDVSEIFSQGMEYLSLSYAENGPAMEKVKMMDSLAVYVEQAAFAEFEHRMYGLTGDALTPEGLCALYEEVALSYGFDSVGYDRREFVETIHYYTHPMYVISYVISNDAAMQLYQLEQETPGAGLARLEENLDSQVGTFLAFLDSAGLDSPFRAGRIREVRQTMEAVLG